MRVCMRCDAAPRAGDSALCEECQDDVKHGRPLPVTSEEVETLEALHVRPPRQKAARSSSSDRRGHDRTAHDRKPAGCWFCQSGRREANISTGPLCSKCFELLHGSRAYLRTICSSLEPLE